MALTDINFQEGEVQDFIGEFLVALYTGSAQDIFVEPDSTQYLLLEAPEREAGGNIFIMSE